jgi:long-chain acyl-CoA synthetase
VEPRAVPLTHGNLLANVRDLVPVMRSSRERLLSVLPIHHVFELTVGLLVPVVGNGTISYVAKLEPAEIQWMMSATRPTMMVAVPRLLELLHNGIRRSVAAGGPLLGLMFRGLLALSALTGGRHGSSLFPKVHRRFGGSLRRIATGGSALAPGLGRAFQRLGFEVAEGYGMTETSPVLTVNPWGAARFGSVGRPLPGVEIDVRPAAAVLNGTADGIRKGRPSAGEIWVRGANVMAGYYRNPEASRKTLRDGWLDTGDVGFVDADGYLHIAGRSKDVIVTAAGKNVYPEEVEQRYRDLAEVHELVVLGLPTGGHGERVAAVVVPLPDATDEDVERIHAAIAARSAKIPSYQQITRIEIWRGELPKTTTMKVKRQLLRDLVLAESDPRPARSAASSSPPTAVDNGGGHSEGESWVIATLARMTHSRADALRLSDRLVELGVDSLTRVELVAEIEGRLGRRIDDESAAALRSVRDVSDLLESGSLAAGARSEVSRGNPGPSDCRSLRV